MSKKIIKKIFVVLVFIIGCCIYYKNDIIKFAVSHGLIEIKSYNLDEIPKYTGDPYVYINNNEPDFTGKDLKTKSFEKYSKLDYLDRCGVAFANIGIDIMPTEERSSIGMIKPSGWHTV